jgi:hypothetical protein
MGNKRIPESLGTKYMRSQEGYCFMPVEEVRRNDR